MVTVLQGGDIGSNIRPRANIGSNIRPRAYIGSNITPLQQFTLVNVQIDFYYVISARLYNNVKCSISGMSDIFYFIATDHLKPKTFFHINQGTAPQPWLLQRWQWYHLKALLSRIPKLVSDFSYLSRSRSGARFPTRVGAFKISQIITDLCFVLPNVYYTAALAPEDALSENVCVSQQDRPRVWVWDMKGPNTVYFHILNQKRTVKDSLSH